MWVDGLINVELALGFVNIFVSLHDIMQYYVWLRCVADCFASIDTLKNTIEGAAY